VVLVVVAALGVGPGRVGRGREQPATRPPRFRRGDTWWTRVRSAIFLLGLTVAVGVAVAGVIGLTMLLGSVALDRALE
jgi:hypothetical protein